MHSRSARPARMSNGSRAIARAKGGHGTCTGVGVTRGGRADGKRADDVEARAAGSFDELKQQVSQRTEEVRRRRQLVRRRTAADRGGYRVWRGLFVVGRAGVAADGADIGVGGRVVIGNALRSMVTSMGPGLLLGALGLSQEEGASTAGGQPRAGRTNPNRSQH